VIHLKIGFDPYNEQVKSKLPDVTANLVLISHYHFDHANATLFKGNPKIIDSPGNYTFKAINIEGIQSYHDKTHGSQRGKNVIYKLKISGYTVAHLGDLGEMPDRTV
jgi:L-ascorbate metabolism protein UlaG (beta-lactamase superfamily)